LQKDEGTDKNKPANSKDKSDISLFCEIDHRVEYAAPNFKIKYPDNYLLTDLSPLVSSVFHPPGLKANTEWQMVN
jgi:hypothetical protein